MNVKHEHPQDRLMNMKHEYDPAAQACGPDPFGVLEAKPEPPPPTLDREWHKNPAFVRRCDDAKAWAFVIGFVALLGLLKAFADLLTN